MRDMMFLKSYKEYIDDLELLGGKEVAKKFALEIVHYGITGERMNKFTSAYECIMAGLIPFIDNSSKKKAEAIKRTEDYLKRKYAVLSNKPQKSKDENLN